MKKTTIMAVEWLSATLFVTAVSAGTASYFALPLWDRSWQDTHLTLANNLTTPTTGSAEEQDVITPEKSSVEERTASNADEKPTHKPVMAVMMWSPKVVWGTDPV